MVNNRKMIEQQRYKFTSHKAAWVSNKNHNNQRTIFHQQFHLFVLWTDSFLCSEMKKGLCELKMVSKHWDSGNSSSMQIGKKSNAAEKMARLVQDLSFKPYRSKYLIVAEHLTMLHWHFPSCGHGRSGHKEGWFPQQVLFDWRVHSSWIHMWVFANKCRNIFNISQTGSVRVDQNLLNFLIDWLMLPGYTKLVGLSIGWGVRRRDIWIILYFFIFRIIGPVGPVLVAWRVDGWHFRYIWNSPLINIIFIASCISMWIWLLSVGWTKLIRLCIGGSVRRRSIQIILCVFIFRIVRPVGSGLVVWRVDGRCFSYISMWICNWFLIPIRTKRNIVCSCVDSCVGMQVQSFITCIFFFCWFCSGGVCCWSLFSATFIHV